MKISNVQGHYRGANERRREGKKIYFFLFLTNELISRTCTQIDVNDTNHGEG